MNDIQRIADLCLVRSPQQIKFDELSDKIRVLELDVEILCRKLEESDKRNQQYKKAIESI